MRRSCGSVVLMLSYMFGKSSNSAVLFLFLLDCGGMREWGHLLMFCRPGAIHGYDAFAPTAKISQAARSARVIWLKRVFAEAEAGLKIVASL